MAHTLAIGNILGTTSRGNARRVYGLTRPCRSSESGRFNTRSSLSVIGNNSLSAPRPPSTRFSARLQWLAPPAPVGDELCRHEPDHRMQPVPNRCSRTGTCGLNMFRHIHGPQCQVVYPDTDPRPSDPGQWHSPPTDLVRRAPSTACTYLHKYVSTFSFYLLSLFVAI